MSVVISEDCVEKAADTLARSFFHYPYPGGAVSDDVRQANCLSVMFSLELNRVCEFGEIVADSSDCRGVAVWCRMGDINNGVSLSKQFRALVSSMKFSEIIKTVRRCLSIERGRKRMKLADDVVYLYILGVEPEYQGQGIGSSLVREKLAECDKEHRTVYLETNTWHNVGYYESFGFTLEKTVEEEHGEFTTWYMIRHPR